jgi:hypothetical protein
LGKALVPSVYQTYRFVIGRFGCTLVAHCRFQCLHCCQTAWIDSIILDVGLSGYASITMAQDRSDDNVGDAKFVEIRRQSAAKSM